MRDQMTHIKVLQEMVVKFRDARDWKQFHNPKDLAISLSLEASELLENFQWRSSEDAVHEKMDRIKDELADVFIYTLLLSNELGIDLTQSVVDKLQKNERKYPVSKAKGSNRKYTDFDD